MRSFDHEAMNSFMRSTPTLKGFLDDMEAWVKVDKNIALKEGDDFGLFTYELPGVYAGHYFFKSRGKAAISTAFRMLEEIFSDYGAKVIIGFTPVENRAAVWTSRHLGFTDHGEVVINNKPFHLFILGREAFTKEMKCRV